MAVKCLACLRDLTEENPAAHGGMPEGSVVSDEKYAEIDLILGRVRKDLEFRSRLGLAHNLKRVQSWFKFHGPWFPALPERAKKPAPVPTHEAYLWAGDFCAFLAGKSWADEVHLAACAANREFPREIARLGGR
jgi:hypothetical protein